MKDYIIGILIVLALSGCYYDNEEELYPGGSSCDTTVTTYAARIQPILQTRCYSCHSAQSAPSGGAGINLESHPVLQSMAQSGILMAAITHSGNASPMPKGMPKLSDCEISKIQRWVDNGAQNN